MPWLRRVEVIVTNKDDPSKQTTFTSHRIDFEVRSTVGWPADTANITLYNLSLDEVKFLQSKNYGDMYIEIRAGYAEDERNLTAGYTVSGKNADANSEFNRSGSIPITQGAKKQAMGSINTLFSGIITNAVGFRRPPEHVTQLFCISKAYGASTDFTQMKPIKPGTTLKDAIQSMCSDYGFSDVRKFGVDEAVLNQVLPRGRVFHDVFLNEFKTLLGEFNLLYSMTTGEIQIFPDTFGDKDAVDRMSKERDPIKLDANAVIGNPIAGICTYNLKTFLNPSAQPGMVLDVSPLLGKELLANGVTSINGQGIILNTDQSVFRWAMEDKYFITEVVHYGSTHSMEYITSICSVLGGNTAMGGRETAWQDMYSRSGMAMESF